MAEQDQAQATRFERLASAWLGELAQEQPEHPLSQQPDLMANAALGRLTANISPAAMASAYVDWLMHLQLSPAKQQFLMHKAWKKTLRWLLYAAHSAGGSPAAPAAGIDPLPQDKRFAAPEWKRWPFDVMAQAFLAQQQWWHVATTDTRGVSQHHEDVVTFTVRQWLDMVAPSNFVFTNPVVLDATLRSGGANLAQGAANAFADWKRSTMPGAADAAFKVGRDVAVTPGKVIYSNRLIELIRYAPATPQVHAMPVLFVPAWIMKYYILDLSPQNSLVKYLVDHGHTVFMISWKNPLAEDRDLAFDDYRSLGVMAAIAAALADTGAPQLQGVGYCLGGTILAIAAAAMARDGDTRLASMSLFAAQVDFKEPGELSLFIDESQISFLEAIMWDQGYLDTRQMAGAFQLLRSNDLIWSRRLHQYLLGQPEQSNDLMAWNSDATRMPYRMHSEYLRQLFLHNDLAEGRYQCGGRSVSLADISIPVFAVGTLTDHVAPWRSVYKIHQLTSTEVSFLLTTGGHNAGVVSPPGSQHRSYQLATRAPHAPHVDADNWQAGASSHAGSWWPAWEGWLATRAGALIDAKPMSKRERDAPGTYVLQQ